MDFNSGFGLSTIQGVALSSSRNACCLLIVAFDICQYNSGESSQVYLLSTYKRTKDKPEHLQKSSGKAQNFSQRLLSNLSMGRMNKGIHQLYEFGRYRLDAESQVLFRDEQAVHLPPKAVELLSVLVERHGQVVSKEQLMNLLWRDTIVEESNLTQNVFLLRKAFGEDGDKRSYIETIPRRGYRFVAEVKETVAGLPAYRVASTEDQPNTTRIEKYTFARIITEEEIENTNDLQSVAPVLLDANSRKLLRDGNSTLWKSRKLLLAAFIIILLVGVVVLWIAFQPSTQIEIKTVAVLPLKSLDANETDQAMGLKLADALILRLGRLRQLVVRPTRAVQRYEGTTLDPLEAGRQQQVDAVLDGSFQRAGDRLLVRAQLLRVSDGQQLWSGIFEERSSDPFFLQDALAENAAQALVPKLAGEERRLLARHDTENINAYRLYIEGRAYWNRRNLDGLKKSIVYFEQALQLDPQYARAYSGMADSYITLSDYDVMPAREAYPKAQEAALKALAIDDTLVEAHTSLAMIKASYDWDWQAAEQTFRRAIELNPNYATAHQWYSEYLAGMGRRDEAIAEIRRAQALDPLSLIIRSVEAWVLYFARDYDQMLAQCQRVIEIDETFGEAYAYMGLAYEQKGRFREAMDSYQKYSTLMGNNTPAAAAIRASAIANMDDYWRKMVELAKPPTGSDFEAAQAFSRLGEADKALDLLEQVYAKRDYHVMYLKVHPNLDPLRQNPRFQNLLRRSGLAESEK